MVPKFLLGLLLISVVILVIILVIQVDCNLHFTFGLKIFQKSNRPILRVTIEMFFLCLLTDSKFLVVDARVAVQ